MGDIVETRQNELKTKKICRFCLTQNASELSNIYSRENRMKTPQTAPLPLQVMACVSIEVFSNDCMPGYVCNECRLIFDYCYRFKQMCKKADTCLRHYPLTGLWSAPMDKPKIPVELLRNKKTAQKNLNALQIPKSKEVSEVMEEIEVDEDKADLSVMTLIPEEDQISPQIKGKPQIKHEQQHFQLEIDEAEIDIQYVQKKAPAATPKQICKTPGVKILNKSAIRILNKEAQRVIEPIMSKPVLQRDVDGNLAIVTEILEPNNPNSTQTSVTDAAILETNVFPCPHCERSFPLRQLLDIHMVNHNRERTYFCEFCDKSFFSKYDLQKHILTHTGEKPYVCVVCQKGFTRSTLLHRHEKIHIDIPKFICVYCEKPFISQDEMEKHTERHRKHRPYVCKICQKAFAFKQGLERHEIVHCRQQPFQCQYCDQSFSTPSKLSRHLTAHAGARPYPCKLCPKSYLLSHHLTRHMRSHKNGSGSYKCNDCQKTFGTRDDLIYHSAVHATQTMVCPLCKDAFEDIETVTEHVKQHAEGEAYACEFCDFIYMTPERLEDHIKDDHAADMVAYNEDNNKSASIVKKQGNDDDSMENQNKEIDDVIEEFLYEEFPNESPKAEQDENVIVKEEKEWERQLENDNDNQASFDTSHGSKDNEATDAEALEFINEIEMSEAGDEPPVKIKKIDVKSQDPPKKVIPKQTTLRRKLPTRPPPVLPVVSPTKSNSTSPKENKNPTQKTPLAKTIITPKPAIPKTRQPTIQAALRAIPKSVSIKKIEASPKQLATSLAPPAPAPAPAPPVQQTETPTRKPSPRKVPAVAKVEPKVEAAKTAKQSPNTVSRMLRQRPESSEIKLQTKPSPVAAALETKKKLIKEPVVVKKSEETPKEDKKLVEMLIGDKKVKVQRITMSKAQVAEMTRDGRIQMKGGAMILKKQSTISKKC